MTTVLTTTLTTVAPSITTPTAPKCTYRAWHVFCLVLAVWGSEVPGAAAVNTLSSHCENIAASAHDEAT